MNIEVLMPVGKQTAGLLYDDKSVTSDNDERKHMKVGIDSPNLKIEYSRNEHELFNDFVDI